MRKNVFLAVFVWCVVATSGAHSAPTLYSISAVGAFGQFPEFNGSTISGTFMYDPVALQTGTTTSSQNPANAALYGGHLLPSGPHSSYTALNATVSGGDLSSSINILDPRGTTIVSNEGFTDTVTGQRVDILALDADPFGPGGIHNIVPFTLGDHTLWNVRMFWIEGQTNPAPVPDILSDQNLPEVLPSIQGRLVLDFIPTGSTTGSPLSFAFFTGLTVTPVSALPEPETYALILAGLGLLGFTGRKKPLHRR
jgi:hypothetical protein